MTAVLISGTFKRDERPDNGLEEIAGDLVKDEVTPRVVVGIVLPHAYKKEVGGPTVPVVRFRVIEVVDGDDAATVQALIDKQRRARGIAANMDSLFDHDPDGGDDDDPGDEDD